MHQSRSLRALRGVAAATTATFAALFWHVASGGADPQLVGVLATWVIAAFVCVLLAGRRLSLARLSVAVVASQLVFHSLFSAIPSSDAADGAIRQGAHAMHGLAATPLHGATSSMIGADATMWLGHGLAAALTILLIHRYESVLSVLAGFTWFVMARIVVDRCPAAGSPRTVSPRGARWDERASTPSAGRLPESTSPRGPPAHR